MHEYGDYGVLWPLVRQFLERINNNGYIVIFHVLSKIIKTPFARQWKNNGSDIVE